ncbi:CBS domain-containing protein [Sphingobacteriales bacterium UPWRP_1]|nr:CBS domain-containing protein [Sphingobacteriales bacterium TSM_CSS]PSJ73709.1 CBS domain-containing protein [Sphingobacteriales bacterium UPWRP_1]
MGSDKVLLMQKDELQEFVVHILRDLKALEKMLEQDMFERNVVRIGAEQELCLIDKNWKPAMINMKVLEKLNNKAFTTELAQFNLEMNIEPQIFTDRCLGNLELEIDRLLNILRETAGEFDAGVILTGILPTVRKHDLNDMYLTPKVRYKALMDALREQRGSNVELKIQGIDELITKHGSMLIEGCNTGFQVHLQVAPHEFVQKYNIAQAITGPVLSVATNSPLLFGQRLWHETRIALFQQSVDVRTAGDNLRTRSARVMFGNSWVEGSILDIYREDIMRFRVLLNSSEEVEDPFEVLEKGGIPNLKALQVNNSTVYRWNRPCYGITNGKPHLRIENRVFPSGPTVKDEIANSALWLGLMNGLGEYYPDITQQMEFEDAKSNFLMAARSGLNTTFSWVKGKKVHAPSLILEELVPIAIEGLRKAKIDDDDIGYYMGIIEQRVKLGQTPSQWMLKSYNQLLKETSKEEARSAITASIVAQQQTDKAVHEWELASLNAIAGWNPNSLIVEDFMQTDLFTVYEDDAIELVAEIMDWQRLKYVPVENQNGKLVGLVTARLVLRHLLHQYYQTMEHHLTKRYKVADVMIKDPLTIGPDESLKKALDLMQTNKIGCLPVVRKGELLGIITEQDYLKVAGRLIYNIRNEL